MAAPRHLRTLANTPETPLKAERNINRDDIRTWLAESCAKLKDAERQENSMDFLTRVSTWVEESHPAVLKK